jgi:hypothetical protein
MNNGRTLYKTRAVSASLHVVNATIEIGTRNKIEAHATSEKERIIDFISILQNIKVFSRKIETTFALKQSIPEVRVKFCTVARRINLLEEIKRDQL